MYRSWPPLLLCFRQVNIHSTPVPAIASRRVCFRGGQQLPGLQGFHEGQGSSHARYWAIRQDLPAFLLSSINDYEAESLRLSGVIGSMVRA